MFYPDLSTHVKHSEEKNIATNAIVSRTKNKKVLRYGIWLYILLLIFEGALRKWILPGLSTPLLIIRDPLAIWLLVTAVRQGVLKANVFTFSMVFL
ncbi:MAG: hypothetical protein WKF89_18125, partial [Chitinophagaceae bacterium]